LENGLLLNSSKTEAVAFGTASGLRSVDISGGVKVAGASLQFSDTVKLLGVELDHALSMDRHASSIVSSCNFHIHALRHIRPRLTFDAAKRLQLVSLVHVSTTATVCSTVRLQRAQNWLARSSAAELRRYSLPIHHRQRVDFKLGAHHHVQSYPFWCTELSGE